MRISATSTRRQPPLCLAALALGSCVLLAACTPSATSTSSSASAAPRPAATLAAQSKPATKWDEFHQHVQPFLAKHCYECHGDDNAENGFRLDVIKDADSLEENGKSLEKALKNLANHKMPPKDEEQPPEVARTEVVGWLKTYLAGDPNGPINPGRVTLRRLNRAEYNNTIRDLLALDIRPADSFPVDDAGYGFDNNGDVLSLAPVLMEKYLAAASLAVEKAIHADPIVPPPLQRWDAASLEGTILKSDPAAVVGSGPPPGVIAARVAAGATPPLGGAGGAGGAGRRTMPVGRVFQSSGEIYVDYELPSDGEYVFRARAYGTQGAVSKQRPQAAFSVDGQPVAAPFTIKEELRNTSVYAVEKTRLTGGKHRIALALTNGFTPEEAAEAARTAPPPVKKTDAEIAAEEAAAIAAENAAEAAAVAAAAKQAAAGEAGAPPAAGRTNRGGAGRAGAAGRGGAAGAAPSGPAKPTMGVIYFEVEGPLAPTPDRMPESYRRVMVAQPSATVSKAQAAEKILRNFVTRAYRRPVTTAELGEFMALWTKAESDGRPFDQSIDVVLQAVLVSPTFLFRQELEPQPGETGAHTLNEYELASRLSYFLWSSMPDDELFAQAEKGTLRANLSAQVRRMLKDPKSSSLVENFAGQWLQLRAMQNVTPDTAHFPDFDPALRAAMVQETEAFFNAIVQEDRSVLDFIDGDFTFVNERLAKHYGLPGITGENFQRVSLAGQPRGGLLTQASILTITSYPNRTSPVQRGKWVLENLLDAAPPPPPPNVPPLAEGQAQLKGTLRQRMEQHRANAACASCHEQMDGIGFALENFDAVGAWRTQDEGNPIDPSGTLPGGKSFNGPVALRQLLKAQSPEFVHCLVGKLMTFALGRGLETYDNRTLDRIADTLGKNGYKFSTLVEEIVRSDAFQKRNGKQKKGDS